MFSIPAIEPFAVTINQPRHFIHGCPPVRNLAEPLVDQAIQAFVLIPVNMPPERSLTNTQQPRRFLLRHNAPAATHPTFLRISFSESPVTILSVSTSTSLGTMKPAILCALQTRTFYLLPTPDSLWVESNERYC